jgi:Predicted sensor domain
MRITDYISLDFLQTIQDNFSDATGLAAIAVDSEGNYITKGSNFTDFCMKYTRGSSVGLDRCVKCDTECTGTYFCHAGLMDFSVDLFIGDHTVGKIIGGQVLPEAPDIAKFTKIAEDLNVPVSEYLDALKKVPIRSEKSIRSSAQLLGTVINNMLNAEYEKKKNSTMLRVLNDEIGNAISLTQEINKRSKELDKVENKQKILSLNASIESARAGEAGRGFSIVATEFGQLAALSGTINKSIKVSLENITSCIGKLSNAKSDIIKD